VRRQLRGMSSAHQQRPSTCIAMLCPCIFCGLFVLLSLTGIVVSLNVDSQIRDSRARLLLATFAVCLHFTQLLFYTLRVTAGCLCHFEAFIHRVTNLLQCVSCVISLITLVLSFFWSSSHLFCPFVSCCYFAIGL